MYDNQVNQSDQSIDHKITYVGPPPKPVYFAWINITDSITQELWKVHSCLCKVKRNKRLFETRMELKIVREKTGFLKFILKLESWELNLRMRILEVI